ncbi:MAG: AAA family ATPase, partial [Bacteroidales bacterium]|nr:AAA family ATPase [Bacteroidales bacterium]
MIKQYIHRELHSEIKRLKTHFPIIVLTGPRQSGKTTLTKNLFSDFHYVDMTRATDRQMIENSP